MADLRWMRAIFLVAVILVLAAGAVFANDVSSNQTPAEKRVTLQLADTPVIDVIDYLFKGTGYKYTIEPGVSGIISVGFKGIPFDQAVKAVADASGLEYTANAGHYVFGPRPITRDASAASQYQDQPVAPPDDEYRAPSDYEGGPVFYGTVFNEQTTVNGQFPPVVPIYDVNGMAVLDYPYGGLIDLSPQSTYHGVHEPFIPSELISPSHQRFYDEIAAVHSVPGFPVWGFKDSYHRPYGRPFGHPFMW